MKQFLSTAGGVLVSGAILLMMFGTQLQEAGKQLGSVSVSSEYVATSTAANTVYGGFTTGRLIKSGYGTLGQVTITGANTGIVNIYNATTTNVNLRAGNKATSTILIASIPASAAAGTYVFDAQFTDGLFLDLNSGIMPTTTVTYR